MRLFFVETFSVGLFKHLCNLNCQGIGYSGMPTEPNLYANELVEAFKKKHEANGYKEMVVSLTRWTFQYNE